MPLTHIILSCAELDAVIFVNTTPYKVCSVRMEKDYQDPLVRQHCASFAKVDTKFKTLR